jgi:hypothetical protein
MSTYVWAYNNFSIRFTIEAESENRSYILLSDMLENMQEDYPVQLPDINCFDLVTMY